MDTIAFYHASEILSFWKAKAGAIYRKFSQHVSIDGVSEFGKVLKTSKPFQSGVPMTQV